MFEWIIKFSLGLRLPTASCRAWFPHKFDGLFKDGFFTQSRKLRRAAQLRVAQYTGIVVKRRASLLVMSAQTESQLSVCLMSVKSTQHMLIPVMVSSKKSSTVCVEGVGRFSCGLQCAILSVISAVLVNPFLHLLPGASMAKDIEASPPSFPLPHPLFPFLPPLFSLNSRPLKSN